VFDVVADTAAVATAESAAVETLTAPPVPGLQKPPRWVGKWFWDCFVAAPRLKVKIPRSENDTHLAAAEPPGGLAAAEPPGRLPGGQPRRRRLLGAVSAAVQAFRHLMVTISSQDPTRSVKERALQQRMSKRLS
jgi:hypothetical protein